MKRLQSYLVLTAATVSFAGQAAATLPTPPMAAATSRVEPYLFHGGAGDVFEITTSMIALQKSQNPELRAFASMLIDHHSRLTSAALAAATAAGVMPPPPELSPAQKSMIGALLAAAPATFDRTWTSQQVMAHRQALTMNQGYAARGDVPALRQAAQGAIPTIQSHLGQAERMAEMTR